MSASIPGSTPVAETTPAPAVPELPYEQVAALAYSFWEARGYQGGSSEEDWLRAEQELLLRRSATA